MSFAPLVKPNVREGIIELLLGAVQKLHVVIVELPILLGLPELTQAEITQNLLPRVGSRGPVYKGQEQLPDRFDVRRADGDVEESDLRERRKQAGVGHEMSLKAIETQEPRVNKAEGNGWRRSTVSRARRPYCLTDVQFPAQVIHLVGFGFEIAVIEMSKDEIQDHQPRANVLDGMLAAIAQVLPTNCSIHEARKEVVDAPVADKETRGGVPLS
jgi:hypothetical protein